MKRTSMSVRSTGTHSIPDKRERCEVRAQMLLPTVADALASPQSVAL